MRILCVHGWAFGPAMWQAMNGRLVGLMDDDALEIECADLGFYGESHLPSGHFDLAIGHSFGLLWLLDSGLAKFDRLVAVNGFTRFAATEDFQCGWPHRIIQRMRKGLASSADAVIAEFLKNSGLDQDAVASVSGGQPDVERLDWALEALINNDGREQWDKFGGPRRVIAATKDNIVTTEHTNQCFSGGDIQWLKSDCHCLPVKFPEICAALIRELMEVS